MFNQLKCARLLIQHGANVKWVNRFKQTGIHISCINGSFELTELLVKHGCDYLCLDSLGLNALDYACQSGNQELVRFLISLKESHILFSGQCLFNAINCSHPYIVEILLKNKFWMLMLLRCEENMIIAYLIEKMVCCEIVFISKLVVVRQNGDFQ